MTPYYVPLFQCEFSLVVHFLSYCQMIGIFLKQRRALTATATLTLENVSALHIHSYSLFLGQFFLPFCHNSVYLTLNLNFLLLFHFWFIFLPVVCYLLCSCRELLLMMHVWGFLCSCLAPPFSLDTSAPAVRHGEEKEVQMWMCGR